MCLHCFGVCVCVCMQSMFSVDASVHVYMSICLCLSVCASPYVCRCMSVCVCISESVCLFHVSVCVLYMHRCVCAYMSVHVYMLCVSMWMYSCVCVYRRVCVNQLPTRVVDIGNNWLTWRRELPQLMALVQSDRCIALELSGYPDDSVEGAGRTHCSSHGQQAKGKEGSGPDKCLQNHYSSVPTTSPQVLPLKVLTSLWYNPGD